MTPGSAREVLLVGSVGLKDSEEVFRAVGPLLGQRMKRGSLIKRIGMRID